MVKNNTYNYIINEFFKSSCYNVELKGNNRVDKVKLQQRIDGFCDSKQIDLEMLFNELKKDPWIKNLEIKRDLKDNILIINIIEYMPFAILIENNKSKLINETGEEIKIGKYAVQDFEGNLINLSGENVKRNINSLFNLLTSNADLMQKIRYVTKIQDRRWNFEFYNGILVKMPENDEIQAWKMLEEILKKENMEHNLKVIDLRNSEKTYLEWRE
ncbi:MAG: cell division protein FtsQ/DivIB [Rickettsiales bacterium]|jgi:cell division septal protein FtsQ|nr:cell division protein FtsQ/DivIB [Rickettsiales bacterium]